MSQGLKWFQCDCECRPIKFYCERCGSAKPVNDADGMGTLKDAYVSRAILSCLRNWKKQHDSRFEGKSYIPPWHLADCDLQQLEEWATHLGEVWDRTQEIPVISQGSKQ